MAIVAVRNLSATFTATLQSLTIQFFARENGSKAVKTLLKTSRREDMNFV